MTTGVIVSDIHVDHSTLGVSRHDEVERAVNLSVECALDEKADFYACLGDVSDPDSGGATFRAQLVMMRAAARLARYGIRSVWVAGNHDVCEDGTGATTLTPLHALEDAFDTTAHRGTEGLVFVAEQPRVIWLEDDLAVLCLPFTPVSHGVDVAMVTDALWPARSLSNTKPPRVIVLSHLTVPGIVAGEETLEMPRGREVLYPFEQTKRATLRLQGHYHHRQQFDPGDGGPPLVIPGSLARLTFGDEDHEPAWLVVEV